MQPAGNDDVAGSAAAGPGPPGPGATSYRCTPLPLDAEGFVQSSALDDLAGPLLDLTATVSNQSRPLQLERPATQCTKTVQYTFCIKRGTSARQGLRPSSTSTALWWSMVCSRRPSARTRSTTSGQSSRASAAGGSASRGITRSVLTPHMKGYIYNLAPSPLTNSQLSDGVRLVPASKNARPSTFLHSSVPCRGHGASAGRGAGLVSSARPSALRRGSLGC